MKAHLEALKEVLTLGLKAEMFTPGGKVNLITLALGFLLAAGADLGGELQPIVRTWNPHYSPGPDDGLIFFVLWIGFALLCVFMLLRYGGTAQLPPPALAAPEPPPALPPAEPKQLGQATPSLPRRSDRQRNQKKKRKR